MVELRNAPEGSNFKMKPFLIKTSINIFDTLCRDVPGTVFTNENWFSKTYL